MPLPGNKQRSALAMIGSHGIQRSPRRNERGLETMFVRDGIAPSPQLFRGSLHLPSRARPGTPPANGPFGFRQTQGPFRRVAETLAATRGKMTMIGNFAGREGFRRAQQQVILQNVKSGPVRSLGFLVAPLPQLAQNGGSAPTEFSRA